MQRRLNFAIASGLTATAQSDLGGILITSPFKTSVLEWDSGIMVATFQQELVVTLTMLLALFN